MIDKQAAIKALLDLQESVNDFHKQPQYRQYVEQHKMGLISGEFQIIDQLLDRGLLRVPSRK
jgi:hypothetical protein